VVATGKKMTGQTKGKAGSGKGATAKTKRTAAEPHDGKGPYALLCWYSCPSGDILTSQNGGAYNNSLVLAIVCLLNPEL
jgi:hypothetical protein